MTNYATLPCRRPIRMSLLCQIEMTLPGGFTELAYEPSVLKRARSNNGSGFLGRCIGRRAGAALPRGVPPPPPPPPPAGGTSFWAFPPQGGVFLGSIRFSQKKNATPGGGGPLLALLPGR